MIYKITIIVFIIACINNCSQDKNIYEKIKINPLLYGSITDINVLSSKHIMTNIILPFIFTNQNKNMDLYIQKIPVNKKDINMLVREYINIKRNDISIGKMMGNDISINNIASLMKALNYSVKEICKYFPTYICINDTTYINKGAEICILTNYGTNRDQGDFVTCIYSNKCNEIDINYISLMERNEYNKDYAFNIINQQIKNNCYWKSFTRYLRAIDTFESNYKLDLSPAVILFFRDKTWEVNYSDYKILKIESTNIVSDKRNEFIEYSTDYGHCHDGSTLSNYTMNIYEEVNSKMKNIITIEIDYFIMKSYGDIYTSKIDYINFIDFNNDNNIDIITISSNVKYIYIYDNIAHRYQEKKAVQQAGGAEK